MKVCLSFCNVFLCWLTFQCHHHSGIHVKYIDQVDFPSGATEGYFAFQEDLLPCNKPPPHSLAKTTIIYSFSQSCESDTELGLAWAAQLRKALASVTDSAASRWQPCWASERASLTHTRQATTYNVGRPPCSFMWLLSPQSLLLCWSRPFLYSMASGFLRESKRC